MSLFIGSLAFAADDAAGQADVRIGVALASLLSGALGMAVLSWAGSRRANSLHGDGS
jgi:Na+/H+ antiporter NhaA